MEMLAEVFPSAFLWPRGKEKAKLFHVEQFQGFRPNRSTRCSDPGSEMKPSQAISGNKSLSFCPADKVVIGASHPPGATLSAASRQASSILSTARRVTASH